MALQKLLKLLESENIAADLDENERVQIAETVMRDLREDEESMREWLNNADKAMEYCQLERSPKHHPYRDAPNIKYPLLSMATVQFASRAFPEVVKNGAITKSKIYGRDPNGIKLRKGRRVTEYINHCMLEKIPNYMKSIRKALHQLPIVGIVYKKTWYDPILETIRSEMIPYDLIVINKNIKSLKDAPRISHYIYLSEREMVEHMRFGLFRDDVDISDLKMDTADNGAIYHELVEQHRELDLDEDGMPEPYIVTVHVASNQVMRIVPRFNQKRILADEKGRIKRIIAQHFFSHIPFIENPDGSFLPLGFGTMLLDIQEVINTIDNQLIAAGHLANTQGGIISKDLRIRKEDLSLERGEWIVAESAGMQDLKESIVPFNYKEPSLVLFELMKHLIESVQSFTGTTDVLTGTADTTNASPNTVYALITQSLKVNSSIVKSIMMGLKDEIDIILELISEYLDVTEYLRIVDPDEQELTEMFHPETGQLLDFDFSQFDVVPVADGEMSTEAENSVRSQQELIISQAFLPTGAVDPREALRSQLMAIQSPNVDKIVTPPPDPNAPNPAIIQLQAQLDLNSKQLQLKDRELRLKEMETAAKVKQIITQAVKNIADAEATEAGAQLSIYQHVIDQISNSIDYQLSAQDLNLRKEEAAAQRAALSRPESA